MRIRWCALLMHINNVIQMHYAPSHGLQRNWDIFDTHYFIRMNYFMNFLVSAHKWARKKSYAWHTLPIWAFINTNKRTLCSPLKVFRIICNQKCFPECDWLPFFLDGLKSVMIMIKDGSQNIFIKLPNCPNSISPLLPFQPYFLCSSC